MRSAASSVSAYLADLPPDRLEAIEAAYAATGKRYDCGKSCVRFRRLDELPLEVVGDAIASMSMESFIATAKSAQKS